MPADEIEELRPIVEAAVRYEALVARVQGGARPADYEEAQDEFYRLLWTGRPSRLLAQLVAPLLTAYEELERRLALAEAVVVAGEELRQAFIAVDPSEAHYALAILSQPLTKFFAALAAWRRATEREEGEGT